MPVDGVVLLWSRLERGGLEEISAPESPHVTNSPSGWNHPCFTKFRNVTKFLPLNRLHFPGTTVSNRGVPDARMPQEPHDGY